MGRRSMVAAVSICVHAIVLFVLMTADLWRPITEWPAPRSAMAFDGLPRPARIENIDPPRPTRAPDTRAIPSTAPQMSLAPVVPPDAILPETLQSFQPEPIAIEPERDGGGSNFGPGNLRAPAIPPAPPAQPPVPQAPIHLHSGIRPPQRIVNVTPVYPAIARTARVQGVVIIEATIDDRGNVTRVEILRSIPLLDAAALDAVRQWKFSPTQLNGVAVPIVMTVTVNFMLAE